MEKKVKKGPNDSRFHSTLGIAYAAIGKKREALIEMDKAQQLRPLESNAMYGPAPMFDAILIHLYNGDTDAALDQLELTISFPSPFSLRYLDWYLPLQPLKEHSRYAELKKKYGIK